MRYAKGVLSPERYQKVTAKYEQEQRELADEVAALDKFVQREQESSDNFNRFMELIAKYIGIEELTSTIVNECVRKIIVHEADNSTGKHVQQIEIVFNFISSIDLSAAAQPITVTKGLNEKIA